MAAIVALLLCAVTGAHAQWYSVVAGHDRFVLMLNSLARNIGAK